MNKNQYSTKVIEEYHTDKCIYYCDEFKFGKSSELVKITITKNKEGQFKITRLYKRNQGD